MNFKLKIFLITAFAACLLILASSGSIYAENENVSDEKTQVSIENGKPEVLSKEEIKKKRLMEEQQRKELLNNIEIRISANNTSYTLIYAGIFFAGLVYAFLTLRGKEDISIQNQNGMNSKK